MEFATTDLIVFAGYIIAMMGFGIWIANRDKAKTSQDYFLASKALPWWAVGGSLIASNISTEQIMGMNGSGFEIGMAIASYELMAAITLIIVAKFFLPVFIKEGISTMPQFLERRYNKSVRSIMSVFWVGLFVFINITSVLYLGGLAIQSLLGIKLIYGIFGLVVYSASFSIFGGLKAVVWTDVIQVVVLVIGGTLASYFVVAAVGDGSFFTGVSTLFEKTPERFNMIFSPTDTYVEQLTGEVKSSYSLLPGFAVLFGGMWIANIYYWGNNQYIIQRALAAKSLGEAQRGVAFAAFIKLFMPIIVVLPGIAAFILNADIAKADEAFPWVLNNYVSTGFKGLTFAALVAAIGSSISSMVNSASTIFTLDIYKQHINKEASEARLVRVGKIAATVALLIGAMLGPLLGNLGQVVQFIQEYTGFISPGVVVVFIFGMFWKRATPNAGLAVVIASIPLSIAFKALYPDLPFVDRIAITFLICVFLMIGISLYESKTSKEVVTDSSFRWGVIASIVCIGLATGVRILFEDIPNVGNGTGYLVIALSAIGIGLVLTEKKGDNENALDIDKNLFKTDNVFNLSAVLIIMILTVIYSTLG